MYILWHAGLLHVAIWFLHAQYDTYQKCRWSPVEIECKIPDVMLMYLGMASSDTSTIQTTNHTNNLINTEQERVSASDLDIVTKISSPSSRAHLGSLCVIDTPSSRNGDLAWKVLPDKTSKMTSHSEEGGTIVLQVLDRGDEAKMIPWQIANQWNIFLSNDSSVAFSWVPWLW